MHFYLHIGTDDAGWSPVRLAVDGTTFDVSPFENGFPASYIGPHPIAAFVELAAEAVMCAQYGESGTLDRGFELDGEGATLQVDAVLHPDWRLDVRFSYHGYERTCTANLFTTPRSFADTVLAAVLTALAAQPPEVRAAGWHIDRTAPGSLVPLEPLLVLLHGRRYEAGDDAPLFRDTLLELAERMPE